MHTHTIQRVFHLLHTFRYPSPVPLADKEGQLQRAESLGTFFCIRLHLSHGTNRQFGATPVEQFSVSTSPKLTSGYGGSTYERKHQRQARLTYQFDTASANKNQQVYLICCPSIVPTKAPSGRWRGPTWRRRWITSR